MNCDLLLLELIGVSEEKYLSSMLIDLQNRCEKLGMQMKFRGFNDFSLEFVNCHDENIVLEYCNYIDKCAKFIYNFEDIASKKNFNSGMLDFTNSVKY